MTQAVLIKYLIIGLIALCGVAVVSGIVRFVRRAGRSAEAQVVKELVNMVSENGLDFVNEPDRPRLVSNMNRIYLSMIEKDFPGFDWDEIRKMLEDKIKTEYEDKDGFEIDDTVISRYDKTGKKRLILCESSASYDDGEQKKYICIQSVLSFIDSKTAEKENETPHTLICDNCGATLTVKTDGEVVCEYCGAITVGEKVWKVTSIKEK